MDYVKIPQNIRVKDKLIGPLSLMQIIVIAAGAGTSYALFATITKTQGAVPGIMHAVIWWPAIFAIAFAVVRINDISLFRYCLLILEMMSKPRRRVWQPRRGIMIESRMIVGKKKKKGKKDEEEAEMQALAQKKQSEIRLDDLSVILDKAGESAPVAPANQ